MEALLLDNKEGTLVTLVNWTNRPVVEGLEVRVRTRAAPGEIYSVAAQQKLVGNFEKGVTTFTVNLADADYVMLKK